MRDWETDASRLCRDTPGRAVLNIAPRGHIWRRAWGRPSLPATMRSLPAHPGATRVSPPGRLCRCREGLTTGERVAATLCSRMWRFTASAQQPLCPSPGPTVVVVVVVVMASMRLPRRARGGAEERRRKGRAEGAPCTTGGGGRAEGGGCGVGCGGRADKGL